MSPFLASSVHVVKKDGSTVDINSNDPTDVSDTPATTPHTAESSKHSKHSSSDGMDGTAVPIVAIVFVFLWLIIKALMAPFTQRATKRARGYPSAGGSLSDEEQAVLLKLQRTILDLERRIESLETILIDEHRTKENYGSKI